MGEPAAPLRAGGLKLRLRQCLLLCQEAALDHGWVREGSPTASSRRGAARGSGWERSSGAAARRRCRWSPKSRPPPAVPGRTALEAAALFNASDDLAHGGGDRRASASRGRARGYWGVNGEVVVTFIWEISWYQYRVSPAPRSPCDSPSAASSRESWRRASPSGTRTSRTTAVSSRKSRACSARILGEAPRRDPARPGGRARRPAVVPAPAPLRAHRVRRERLHRARGGRIAHRRARRGRAASRRSCTS